MGTFIPKGLSSGRILACGKGVEDGEGQLHSMQPTLEGVAVEGLETTVSAKTPMKEHLLPQRHSLEASL
jgi:hypothetical protein